EEAIDGEHRVLVFSQFVSMLHLVRERLEKLEIPFCYLDGSTKQRQEIVDRFQSDSAIPVFLISLKAGGVGLNLSAADTVIHFDPWWNPAVEAQATDRAHRIGQTRVVTAYKLITRDTVEEKILRVFSPAGAGFFHRLQADHPRHRRRKNPAPAGEKTRRDRRRHRQRGTAHDRPYHRRTRRAARVGQRDQLRRRKREQR